MSPRDRRDEQIVEVPMYALEMLWKRGYFRHFWRVVQERGCSHREAWEECERVLETYKMPPQYTSYESFKAGKYRQRWDSPDPDDLPMVTSW